MTSWGFHTRNTYDKANRLLSVQREADLHAFTNGDGVVAESYGYNDAGRRIRETNGEGEQREVMKRPCVIVTTTVIGYSIVVSDSMAVSPLPEIPILEPSETHLEDRDAASRAVTSAVGSLFAINLADRDAVGRQLQVRWAAAAGSGYPTETYRGVDVLSGAPFESVEYRRGAGQHVAPWSDVTLKIRPEYCYTDRALVFNYAPERVATPYTPPDGEADGISGRSTIASNTRNVDTLGIASCLTSLSTTIAYVRYSRLMKIFSFLCKEMH